MFRRRLLTLLSVGAVVLASVLTAQPAQASTVTPGRLAPSAQCSKPISQRTGAWMCAPSGMVGRPVRTAGATMASTPRSEYCNGWGCWSVWNDFYASFYGTSIYLGYGGKTIANVHMDIEWHLQGAQSLALPVYSRVNQYTVHTIFSGALSNGADGVAGGGSVKQTCNPNTRPAAAAYALVSYPNGCKLYDNASYDHNQVVQASWNFSNYPGYWYFYARSPVSHDGNRAIYRFHNASDLSGSSSVGGWRS